METKVFTCGHVGDILPEHNFGCGKARQERIAAYFAQRCFTCAVEHNKQFASTLCRLIGKDETGKFISRKFTEPEVAEYVEAKLPLIRRNYKASHLPK